MTENTDVWASWMTGLGILAVIVIFGSAYYWVKSINKGNRGVRFWQRSSGTRRNSAPPPDDDDYPESREDLR